MYLLIIARFIAVEVNEVTKDQLQIEYQASQYTHITFFASNVFANYVYQVGYVAVVYVLTVTHSILIKYQKHL